MWVVQMQMLFWMTLMLVLHPWSFVVLSVWSEWVSWGRPLLFMASEGHGLKHNSILSSETQGTPADTVLSENNNWLDLSTLVFCLTANPDYYWSCSMLKLMSDLSDVLIGIFQWLWSLEEWWFMEAVPLEGEELCCNKKLPECGVSGCHSLPRVPLFVPSANSWGQMLSDFLYPRTCLLFWEQKQVWVSFWICICNAPSLRILHLRLPFASDLWKIWISKDYCKECCVMLMSLIRSIIPKFSVSWQVSLNKCTLQPDPAKRINSMS